MLTGTSVVTPIRVSHILETQIFFSVHGFDARDQPVLKNGPGQLRIMRLQTRVVLPAVSRVTIPGCVRSLIVRAYTVYHHPCFAAPARLYVVARLQARSRVYEC